MIQAQGELTMNDDILKDQWKQMSGQIKTWWGVLTDDDLDKINGRRDRLINKLQEKYGFTKEQAAREIDDHLAQLKGTPVMGH
jgi:uncharacterized protein YjbJ (UPF0337 family)